MNKKRKSKNRLGKYLKLLLICKNLIQFSYLDFIGKYVKDIDNFYRYKNR